MIVREAQVPMESPDDFKNGNVVPDCCLMNRGSPSTVPNVELGRICCDETSELLDIPTLSHLISDKEKASTSILSSNFDQA